MSVVWLVALIVASGLDLWFTSMVVGSGGSELNPVMASLMESGRWAPVVGKFAAMAAGWGLWALSGRVRVAGVGLRLVTVATASAVLYTVGGLWWA